jgi:hypothetical protein
LRAAQEAQQQSMCLPLRLAMQIESRIERGHSAGKAFLLPAIQCSDRRQRCCRTNFRGQDRPYR